MAPDANARERIYSSIREDLQRGLYPPGARIDIQRIADQNHSSVTPVREVLARLSGEALVQPQRHGGFRAMHLDAPGLDGLYRWNALVLVGATHLDVTTIAVQMPVSIRPGTTGESAAAGAVLVADIFLSLATATRNRDVERAVALGNTRLAYVRLVEGNVLRRLPEEIANLAVQAANQDIPGLRRSILSYHQRRISHLPELMKELPRFLD